MDIYKISKEEYAQIFNPVFEDMAPYIEYLGDGADTVTVRAPDCNWSVEAINLNLIE